MKLMISAISAAEAQVALEGGAEIVDIKNPEEGSLGAQSPNVIREIRNLCHGKAETSAAIGDMPNLPGTAALAALGAAVCGVDYIKVGLWGPKNETEARVLLQRVRQSLEKYPVSVIAAGYADSMRAGTLDPRCLPRLAASAGMDGLLLDTAIKDGRSLFDFLDAQRLRSMAEQAHAAGLMFGLAGSLGAQDISPARDLGADIVGVRTAVCRDNQRTGSLEADRIRTLLAYSCSRCGS
jgi:uncharacterized protein (UPF0264 family)